MGCPQCGSDEYGPTTVPITRPRRVKFGAIWLIATLLTGGLALLAYIVWPRIDETIGYHEIGWCPDCYFEVGRSQPVGSALLGDD